MTATICELCLPLSAVFFDYVVNGSRLSLVQIAGALLPAVGGPGVALQQPLQGLGLGPGRVLRAERGEIQFRGRLLLALLAYLAVESGQAHSRESLLGLLWPEMTEAEAVPANPDNEYGFWRVTFKEYVGIFGIAAFHQQVGHFFPGQTVVRTRRSQAGSFKKIGVVVKVLGRGVDRG